MRNLLKMTYHVKGRREIRPVICVIPCACTCACVLFGVSLYLRACSRMGKVPPSVCRVVQHTKHKNMTEKTGAGYGRATSPKLPQVCLLCLLCILDGGGLRVALVCRLVQDSYFVRLVPRRIEGEIRPCGMCLTVMQIPRKSPPLENEADASTRREGDGAKGECSRQEKDVVVLD